MRVIEKGFPQLIRFLHASICENSVWRGGYLLFSIYFEVIILYFHYTF